MKIFNDDSLSISEYVKLVCYLRKQKDTIKLGNRNDDTEDNDRDDKDAGDVDGFSFWNLPDTYYSNWRDNLRIQLLPEEAAFLKRQIIKEHSSSLFAFILKNRIDVNKYNSFNALYESIKDSVPEELRKDMWMAYEFNRFIQIAFTQFNLIVSAERNGRALDKWNTIKGYLKEYALIDLEAIYVRFKITNYPLRTFLNSLKSAALAEDIDKIRQIIIKRENNLKGKARAKVNRVGEFDENAWIGIEYLDYRFSDAKRIINDIYEGEAVIGV